MKNNIKKVLLFGATGQIGQALQAATLPPDLTLIACPRARADITNHGDVQKALREEKPDIIINAAAMTNVDGCETNPDAAVTANFEAAANLAAQCGVMDVPLIHLSTDYVFDGTDNTPYTETAPMNPVSIYGNTKMMGEESIRHELPFHVILRVSSVFSEFGNNLLTRTLQWIDTKDEIRSVTDQVACPTYAPDIAAALLTIATAILGGQHGFGTFHYCGAPAVTRKEFTEAIAEAYAPYTTRRPPILPALSADFPGANRPPNSTLDCTKIKAVYGIAQKPWRDGLARAIMKLKSQKV